MGFGLVIKEKPFYADNGTTGEKMNKLTDTINKEIVLDFSPSGSATSLHFDEFSLGFLGPMKVWRASEISFNETTQSWDVCIFHKDDNIIVNDFPRYNVARNFEIEFIQTCRRIEQNVTRQFCTVLAKGMRLEFLTSINRGKGND